MALSKKSKILVSDITSALAGKQDALGYIPVKSVNGTSADSTGDVVVSSANSAEAIPNVVMKSYERISSFTLPSGGTWSYWWVSDLASSNTRGAGVVSGGSSVFIRSEPMVVEYIAIRTA